MTLKFNNVSNLKPNNETNSNVEMTVNLENLTVDNTTYIQLKLDKLKLKKQLIDYLKKEIQQQTLERSKRADKQVIKIDVPRDNSCLFWSVALAYLAPVKDDANAFQQRYEALFGNADQINHVRGLIQNYNPRSGGVINDHILAHLVTRTFRDRVVDEVKRRRLDFEGYIQGGFDQYLTRMRNPTEWGGEHEIDAMSRMLYANIRVFGAIQSQYNHGDIKIRLYHVNAGGQEGARNHYHFGLEQRVINTFHITGSRPQSNTQQLRKTRIGFAQTLQQRVVLQSNMEVTEDIVTQNHDILYVQNTNEEDKYSPNENTPNNKVGITTSSGKDLNLQEFKFLIHKELEPIEAWIKGGGRVVIEVSQDYKNNPSASHLFTSIIGLKDMVNAKYLHKRIKKLLMLGKQIVNAPQDIGALKQKLQQDLTEWNQFYDNQVGLQDSLNNYAKLDDGIKEAILDKNQNLILKEVTELIAGDFDINSSDTRGNTLLHYACKQGNYALVQLLLNGHTIDDHVNLNIPNVEGDAPLLIAIQNKVDVDIARMLIKRDADVNQQNNEGLSALNLAIIHREIQIVEQIINTDRVDINLSDINDNTALHAVADYRNLDEQQEQTQEMQQEKEIAEKIVDNTNTISLQNREGNTPLHVAAINGNEYIVELFLKKDYLFPQQKILSIVNNDGRTVIHEAVLSAVRTRNLKILEILIRIATPADLNVQNHYGQTVITMIEQFQDKTKIQHSVDLLNHQLNNFNYGIGLFQSLKHQQNIENVHDNMALLQDLDTKMMAFCASMELDGTSKLESIGIYTWQLSVDVKKLLERAKELLIDIRILLDNVISLQKRRENTINEDLSIEILDLRSSIRELLTDAKLLSNSAEQLLIRVGTLLNTGWDDYLNRLNNVDVLLKQQDYQAWKTQQLNLLSSFPNLESNPDLLNNNQDLSEARRLYQQGYNHNNNKQFQDATNSLDESITLYQAVSIQRQLSSSEKVGLANAHWLLGLAYKQLGQYENARENIENSIRLYAKAKQYSYLEAPYQQLALIHIKLGTIKDYINSHQATINDNANDIDKLCSHLALAGSYRMIRQHGYTLEDLDDVNFQESFHYSEAYKFTQGSVDNNAHVVLQREMGITNNENIGTYNIQQCVAVIAHDPNTKKVVLSHFDRFSGPLKFIDQILKQFPLESQIDIYLSGGRDRYSTSDDDTREYLISDNNIDQVLKQIYHYRNRFNIQSTDVGNKLSPAGIVFDVGQRKLVHSTPNRPDTSLNSRAAKMQLQLRKYGDYLQPIDVVDFSQDQASRTVQFSDRGQMLEKYRHNNDFRTRGTQTQQYGSLMWFYNQIFHPLLVVLNNVEGIQPRSDTQQIITDALESRGNLNVEQNNAIDMFDLQLLQQGNRQQNPDTVNYLCHNNQLDPAIGDIDVHDIDFDANQNFADLNIDDACLPPANKRRKLNKRNTREKRAAVGSKCLLEMDEDNKIDKEKTGIEINEERFDESKIDNEKLKIYQEEIKDRGDEINNQLKKLTIEIQQAQAFKNFNNLVKKVHKHLPKDLDIMMSKESLDYFLQIYKINFLRSILPIIHNEDFKNLLTKNPMWLIRHITSEGESLLDNVFVKIQEQISAKYDGVFTTNYQDFEELEDTINQELIKYSGDIQEKKDIFTQNTNKSDLLSYAFKSLGLALLMEKQDVPVGLQVMVYRNTLVNLGMLIHDYKSSIPNKMKSSLDGKIASNELLSVAHGLYNSLSNAEDFGTSDIKKYFDDSNIKDFGEILKAYDRDVINIRSGQVSGAFGEVTIEVQHESDTVRKITIGRGADIKNIDNYVLDEQDLQIKLKIDDKPYIITSELEGERVKYFLHIEGYEVKVGSIISSVKRQVERDIRHKLNQLRDRAELLKEKRDIENIGDTEISDQDYDNTINRIKEDLLQRGVSESTFRQLEEQLDYVNKEVFKEYVNTVQDSLIKKEITFDHSKFELAKIKGAKGGKFMSVLAIYDLFDSTQDLTGLKDAGSLQAIFGINGILDAMDDVRESFSISREGRNSAISRNSKLGKIIAKVPKDMRKAFVKIISNPIVRSITFATIAYQFGHSIDQIVKGENVELNAYFATSSGIKLASMSMRPMSMGVMAVTRGLGAASKVLKGLSIASNVLGKLSIVTMVADVGIATGIAIHERVEYVGQIASQIPLSSEEEAEVFFAKLIQDFQGRDIEKEYEDIIRIKGYLTALKVIAIKSFDNNPNIAAVVQYLFSVEEQYNKIIKHAGKMRTNSQGGWTVCGENCKLERNNTHASYRYYDNTLSNLSALDISETLSLKAHTLVMTKWWEEFECKVIKGFNTNKGRECFKELHDKQVYLVDSSKKHLLHITKSEYNSGIRIIKVPQSYEQSTECGDIKNRMDYEIGGCNILNTGKEYKCNVDKVYRSCKQTFTLSNEPFIFTKESRKTSKGPILYLPGPQELIAAANYPAVMYVPKDDVRYYGSENYETTFIVNDITGFCKLEGGLAMAEKNIISLDVDSYKTNIELNTGNITLYSDESVLSSIIDLKNIYNYFSHSTAQQDITTHCKTRYVNAGGGSRGNTVNQGSTNCKDEDYEVRVVHKNDVHYRGSKQVIFVVNKNSDNATITVDNNFNTNKNSANVIKLEGLGIERLRIKESEGYYNLTLLTDDGKAISIKVVDDLKNLVIQTIEDQVIKMVMMHNKSLTNLIEDMNYQMLDSAQQDSKVLQNSQKKLKAIVLATIVGQINMSSYKVAKDIADNINLNIPIAYVEVITNIAAVPGPKTIISGIYSDKIIIDYNYNMQNYTEYKSKGGFYSEDYYIKKCKHYCDIMAEGNGNLNQYIVKLPNNEYMRNLKIVINKNTYSNVDFRSNTVENVTIHRNMKAPFGYTHLACDSQFIGHIPHNDIDLIDAIPLIIKVNTQNLIVILLNYFKGQEYQNVTFQFNKTTSPNLSFSTSDHEHYAGKLEFKRVLSTDETEEYSLSYIQDDYQKRKRRAINLDDTMNVNEPEILAASSSGIKHKSWINEGVTFVKELVASVKNVINRSLIKNPLPFMFKKTLSHTNNLQGSLEFNTVQQYKPHKARIQSEEQHGNSEFSTNQSFSFNNFLSNENTTFAHCIADALDNNSAKRYQDLRNKAVEVVPSIQTAVNFALNKFEKFVEGKKESLNTEEQCRIHTELINAYPEIIASLERGVEYSGNVGLDDVLEKCKECFCKNILSPKSEEVSAHLSDIEVTTFGNNLGR